MSKTLTQGLHHHAAPSLFALKRYHIVLANVKVRFIKDSNEYLIILKLLVSPVGYGTTECEGRFEGARNNLYYGAILLANLTQLCIASKLRANSNQHEESRFCRQRKGHVLTCI